MKKQILDKIFWNKKVEVHVHGDNLDDYIICFQDAARDTYNSLALNKYFNVSNDNYEIFWSVLLSHPEYFNIENKSLVIIENE